MQCNAMQNLQCNAKLAMECLANIESRRVDGDERVEEKGFGRGRPRYESEAQETCSGARSAAHEPTAYITLDNQILLPCERLNEHIPQHVRKSERMRERMAV
eukprot:CAMPEP_0171523826 /NCGR_PEP_ID=MMETSP0959-20130129/8668_1 /TAXON_ID=87120 /ORGANISM="Aurantiochytrium limacinum, Strain ATCCMYA-1381" /LENGTH=101 /DNA_ID=CAMNT_0012064411 /DNA_START=125 /DNA_END=430 /DNA_ORIENTATION=+